MVYSYRYRHSESDGCGGIAFYLSEIPKTGSLLYGETLSSIRIDGRKPPGSEFCVCEQCNKRVWKLHLENVEITKDVGRQEEEETWNAFY